MSQISPFVLSTVNIIREALFERRESLKEPNGGTSTPQDSPANSALIQTAR
jgi:hypothetical protein